MMSKQSFSWLILLVCLSGCTTVSPPAIDETVPHQPTMRNARAMQTWTAQGALAVQTIEKGWSASFNWEQQKFGNYRLNIFGPLGTNSLLLMGNHHYVTLETNGKIESASNAEVLLERHLGWYIPINNIYYWGRGLSVPHFPVYHVVHNEEGRIQSMVQQSWQIAYKTYNNEGLPTQIELRNPRLFIRIVIRQWDF
jgi:outer membrane lipoprotein LolB